MSVDLSEFEEASSTPFANRCGVAKALAHMDPTQTSKFLAALDAPEITSRAIAKVVTGWGIKLGDQTVTRHRRGTCLCPRT